MLNCLRPFAQRGLALNRSVEVWLADADALDSECAALQHCLSPAERQRLAALHFPRDRTLYRSAHVFLRYLLCVYQPNDPGDWQFDLGSHGRPEILQTVERPADRLRFSLSHTRGLVAVAVARGWRVGVDVERTRLGSDPGALNAAMLAGSEKHWFPQIEPEAREAAFMSLWTIKEALLKACGAGIGEDLDKVALVHSLQDPRVIITRSRHLAGAAEWNVAFGAIGGGDALAVAAQGRLSIVASARVERRCVTIFDLRQSIVHPQGEVLANAVLLPVKAASMAPACTPVPA